MNRTNSHVNDGVRKILETPNIYNIFQNLIGSSRHRKKHYTKHFDLPPQSKILDIGCGTGALLDYINQDIEYHGCDMENSYIDFAKKKYGKRGHFFKEKVGEKFHNEWANYFDAINANALIHHLSDKDSKDLIEVAYQYLKPTGFLITVDTVYHKNQSFLSNWFVSKDRGQNIRKPEQYLELMKHRFTDIEHELLTNHLRIPYSIFVMKSYK